MARTTAKLSSITPRKATTSDNRRHGNRWALTKAFGEFILSITDLNQPLPAPRLLASPTLLIRSDKAKIYIYLCYGGI